jgi:hypothetical protein
MFAGEGHPSIRRRFLPYNPLHFSLCLLALALNGPRDTPGSMPLDYLHLI